MVKKNDVKDLTSPNAKLGVATNQPHNQSLEGESAAAVTEKQEADDASSNDMTKKTLVQEKNNEDQIEEDVNIGVDQSTQLNKDADEEMSDGVDSEYPLDHPDNAKAGVVTGELETPLALLEIVRADYNADVAPNKRIVKSRTQGNRKAHKRKHNGSLNAADDGAEDSDIQDDEQEERPLQMVVKTNSVDDLVQKTRDHLQSSVNFLDKILMKEKPL